MKMFDASPWGSPRLGQFGMNNPYSGGGSPYSWNVPGTQPGSFYGGAPLAPEARVLQRAAAQMSPQDAGGYESQAVAAEECFTCSNPDTGDTQYGIPAAQMKALKAKGYRCRKDACARSDGGYGRFGSFGGGFFGSPDTISPVQGFQAPPTESFSMLSGRGIPLVQGLGTRALA